jgi:hypothetical protein
VVDVVDYVTLVLEMTGQEAADSDVPYSSLK